MAITGCQTHATVLSMRVNVISEARRADTPNAELPNLGRGAV